MGTPSVAWKFPLVHKPETLSAPSPAGTLNVVVLYTVRPANTSVSCA